MDYIKFTQQKEKLDSFRPLEKELVRNLRENLILNWTHHSNAIEGNTLTLQETKVVLEGITIGGKSIREHFETLNHQEAIFYIENLVKEKEDLSQRQIKNIHSLILKNIDNKNAGVYRSHNVTISGAKHIPCQALLVTEKMQKFIDWYKKQSFHLHPIKRACLVHIKFVGIHPFADGNGRTSRLLMNLELLKNGYPAVVVPVEKRLAYYQALDLAHTEKKYNQFIQLILQELEVSFQSYWFALGES